MPYIDPGKKYDQQFDNIRATLKTYLDKHFFKQLSADEIFEIADFAISQAFAEKRYDPAKSELHNFLFKVAWNRALTIVRKLDHKKKMRFEEYDDGKPRESIHYADPRANPEIGPLKKFFFNQFYRAVKKLSKSQREVFLLDIGLRLTDDDIARKLGKKAGAIQKARCTAKEVLEKELSKTVDLKSVPEDITFNLTEEEFFIFTGYSGRERDILNDFIFRDMSETKVRRKYSLSSAALKTLFTTAMNTLDAASIRRKGKREILRSETERVDLFLRNMILSGFSSSFSVRSIT